MESSRPILNPRATRALAPFLLALSLVAGCGGGGSDPLSTETVRVSADPKSVAYGADVAVDWSAVSSSTFLSSNFGVTESSYRGGQIVDTPGTTTTYELRVRSSRGNDVPARATVAVAPSATSVLVVGDASQAGPGQVASFLRTLTTGTVATAAAVPAPSAAYGVLVVSPTLANGAASRANAKAWLDAGKAVVLLGAAPRALATGSATNPDVSAIGAWFLGATRLPNTGLSLGSRVRADAAGTVRLSAAIRGGSDSPLGIVVPAPGPQVDSLVREGTDSGMCAYQPPTGGRLVWSASSVGYGNGGGSPFQQAFESAFRWAAR